MNGNRDMAILKYSHLLQKWLFYPEILGLEACIIRNTNMKVDITVKMSYKIL